MDKKCMSLGAFVRKQNGINGEIPSFVLNSYKKVENENAKDAEWCMIENSDNSENSDSSESDEPISISEEYDPLPTIRFENEIKGKEKQNCQLTEKVQSLESKMNQLMKRISMLEYENSCMNQMNQIDINNCKSIGLFDASLYLNKQLQSLQAPMKRKALTLPSYKAPLPPTLPNPTIYNFPQIKPEALKKQKRLLNSVEPIVCKQASFSQELRQKVKRPSLKKVKHILKEREEQTIDPHAEFLAKLHDEIVFVKAKLKNVKTTVKTIIVCD